MSILAIEERPSFATAVAAWIEHEWERLPIHDYFEAVSSHVRWPRKLPRCFIALLKGELVGTVSLLENDLETRPDLNPWLGCLFVPQKYRRRGIGTELTKFAERCAFFDLRITRLFLFTEDQEQLYRQLGWRRIEECLYREYRVVIMDKYSPLSHRD